MVGEDEQTERALQPPKRWRCPSSACRHLLPVE